MATSGSFTGARGGSSTGPYLKLSWSRIDIDEVNNRSLLRLTLQLVSDYYINFSASKSGNLDGTAFTYTGGFSGTGTKTIKTLDKWITHNSDGSKSEALSASFNIAISWGGSTVSSLSVSGTAAIDTIPRASDFTSFVLSNTVLNTSTAVTVNYTLGRKSTAFSQAMTLKLGSKTIKSWTTTGTGALTQALSTSEVNSIISGVPNGTSGTLTLHMQTKSGSTNIGSSKSINEGFTLNSAIAPSASGLAVSIYGSGRDKTIAKYVQNISKVTASFTRSAGYGATISTSTIVVRRQSDDANSQTIASNSGTTANPVALSGVYEIIATVKDSRGRSDSVSTTITVEAYKAPAITKFTAARSSPSTTVSNAITATWSALGTSNPTDISIKGEDNIGTVVSLYTLNDSTAGSINTTKTYTGQSDASSYTYTITITDSFGKVAKAEVSVGTSFVELTIAKGLGIGVGKVHENGALDVGGSIYLTGNVNADGWFTSKNPNNPEATVSLGWGSNHVPRIRYGGTGDGALNGFEILGTGDSLKMRVGNDGVITAFGLRLTSPHDASFTSTGHGFTVGNDTTGDSVKIDTNEVSASRDGAASTLHLNTDGGAVIIGNNTADNVWMDDGQIQAKIYHTGNYMYVYSYSSSYGAGYGRMWYNHNANQFEFWNQSGGLATVKAYAHTTSLRETKTNIVEAQEGMLDKIRRTPVYNFQLKQDFYITEMADGADPEDVTYLGMKDVSEVKVRTGLIFEEAPGDIAFDGAIDLYGMSSMLWKAVQELADEVDYLRKKVAN
jgi:hypothetical protein